MSKQVNSLREAYRTLCLCGNELVVAGSVGTDEERRRAEAIRRELAAFERRIALLADNVSWREEVEGRAETFMKKHGFSIPKEGV